MTEKEWAGALHWKTWVLAGLDVCISTIKCARHYNTLYVVSTTVHLAYAAFGSATVRPTLLPYRDRMER